MSGFDVGSLAPLLVPLGGLAAGLWLWSRAQERKAFATARDALVSASRKGLLKSAVVESVPEKPVVVAVQNHLEAAWLLGPGMDSVRSALRQHGDYEVRRGTDGASLRVAPTGWWPDSA